MIFIGNAHKIFGQFLSASGENFYGKLHAGFEKTKHTQRKYTMKLSSGIKINKFM
jgi:hypothetical protein